MTTATYPIISADSHITEPPNVYVDYIDAPFRDRAPHLERTERRRHLHHPRHEGAGADGHRRRGRQAGRGDPHSRHALRGPAPRRLGSRGAPRRSAARRRRRRGHLPDRRHGDLQPPRLRLQEGLLRRLQPLDRRVLRGRIPTRLLGAGQTAMRTPAEGIADIEKIKALGLRGVMMPGHAGGRGLRLAAPTTSSGRRRSSSGCRSRSTSSPPATTRRSAARA